MNLVNFSINEFLGILVIFGFYVWLFWIIFNGIGLIKDNFFKK
jgi:hypothetical protein